MQQKFILKLFTMSLFLGALGLTSVAQANENTYIGTGASFIGEASDDFAGFSVAGAGDVNGDGYDELLIGAPYNDESGIDAGAVYLVWGSAKEWSTGIPLNDASVLKWTGEQAGDLAGYSVTPAGDVNSDGYADFIVSAPKNGQYLEGAAYLILGSPTLTGGSLTSTIKYSGAIPNAEIGEVISKAGDTNGDGYDDWLVGTSTIDVVYLVLGSATPTSISISNAISYGGPLGMGIASISGGGDMNGDGYDEFAVGGPDNGSNSGIVYLVHGSANPAGGSLTTYDWFGGSIGERLGTSVSMAGDLNGDGFDDLLAGAVNSGANMNGGLYLLFGQATAYDAPNSIIDLAHRFEGLENDRIGSVVSSLGDINGDGYGDMLIGTDETSFYDGLVYIQLGSTLLRGVDDVSNMDKMRGRKVSFFGINAAPAGDVNGDGVADFIMGTERSETYLFYGSLNNHGQTPHWQHRRLMDNAGDAMPVHFSQARVTVDFVTGAKADNDVSLLRHFFHPCTVNQRLHMPIWSIDSHKVGAGSSIDLTFQYTDGQIQHMDENSLQLWSRPLDDHCGAWSLVGGAVDSNLNTLSATVTELGQQYTIADSEPPTSVEVSSNLTGVRLSSQPWWSVVGLAAVVLAAGGVHWRLRRFS